MTELELLEKIKDENINIIFISTYTFELYNNMESFIFFIDPENNIVNVNACGIDNSVLMCTEIKNDKIKAIVFEKYKQLIEKRLANG